MTLYWPNAVQALPDPLEVLRRLHGGEVYFFNVLILDPAAFPIVVGIVQVPQDRQSLERWAQIGQMASGPHLMM